MMLRTTHHRRASAHEGGAVGRPRRLHGDKDADERHRAPVGSIRDRCVAPVGTSGRTDLSRATAYYMDNSGGRSVRLRFYLADSKDGTG